MASDNHNTRFESINQTVGSGEHSFSQEQTPWRTARGSSWLIRTARHWLSRHMQVNAQEADSLRSAVHNMYKNGIYLAGISASDLTVYASLNPSASLEGYDTSKSLTIEALRRERSVVLVSPGLQRVSQIATLHNDSPIRGKWSSWHDIRPDDRRAVPRNASADEIIERLGSKRVGLVNGSRLAGKSLWPDSCATTWWRNAKRRQKTPAFSSF